MVPLPYHRFEHSSRLHKKITTRVDFPEIVDMSPYISHARYCSPALLLSFSPVLLLSCSLALLLLLPTLYYHIPM